VNSPSVFFLGTAVLLSGCYLSHDTAESGGAPDAAAPDVRGFDVPLIDATPLDVFASDTPPPFDAGPFECEGIRIGAEHALINDWNAIFPRIVALPRGEIGVFTHSAPGNIGRANYQRLNASLERIGESIVLIDPIGDLAVPAVIGDTVYVSYGERGAEQGSGSLLAPFASDGTVVGPGAPVVEDQLAFLSPASTALFWLWFEFSPTETIRAAHINTDGEVLHDVVEIPSGNLIRGTRAVPVDGGNAHVLAYSRNVRGGGFPQFSNGFVNMIRTDGTLGPERQLGEDLVISVTPVVIRNELILVRHQADALVIERANIDTLERIEEFRFDPISEQPLVAQLGGRLLVIHFEQETQQMHVDDFGRDFSGPRRLTIELEGPVYQDGFVVESPATPTSSAGVVVTNQVQREPRGYPWLVRLVCDNAIDG
jgi:hypothetical protein